MREGKLLGVGAQEMDTRGYQVSDLEDIEFHWDDLDLSKYEVFQTCIHTPISPSTINAFETGSQVENPLLIEEEQDKNSFPPTATLASERLTRLDAPS